MNSQRNAKKMLIAGSVILFTLLLSFLVLIRGIKSEIEKHRATVNLVKEAKEVNHELYANILKSRSFLLNNYDPIVQSTTRMREICIEMTGDGFLGNKAHNVELRLAAEQYCLEVDEKIDQVENFKSINSVLRNSFSDIPHLVDDFHGTRYENQSNDFFMRLLHYYTESSAATRHTIENNQDWIKRAGREPKYRDQAATVLLHVRTLLDYLDRRKTLEMELLSDTLHRKIDHVQDVYFTSYEAAQKIASVYRAILLAICLILSVCIIFIFVRLREIGLQLKLANENLEHKVELRTRELQVAMQTLSNSAKMSALGEMAGGIAHEINTPLGSISLCAEMIRKNVAELDGRAELIKSLDQIIATVYRISRIVSGLRRFSRDNSREKPGPVNLKQILTDTLILCQEKFKNNQIDLKIFVSDTMVVECIPEQVCQVILNLLNNSFDAIESKDDKWIRIESSLAGDFVELVIVDSGTGIPASVQDKMMQPFFTTKPIGKGTGIGLSISKGLLTAQNGMLRYENGSKNTTFVISLPLHDEFKMAI